MTMKRSNTCKSIWYWFIQLVLWGAIVFVIIAVSQSNKDLYTAAFITLGISWFIYVISNLCSATCSYLNHMTQNSSIHGYMLSLYKERPRLSFSVTCYHYETRHNHSRDAQGNERHTTKQVRVVTHSETRDFHYMSSRDVSGIFRLDSESVVVNPNKNFVKLNLKLNVRKSEDGTHDNYVEQRDRFFLSNRWRDVHMDTHESTYLNGFNEYNLVSIGDTIPISVNLCFFILSTFIGFAQFYKKYVDSFCVYQEYTVVKEISSFRNLNAQEFHCNYSQFNPSIVFNSVTILNFNDPSHIPINSAPYVEISIPMQNQTEAFEQNQGGMTQQTPAFQQNQVGFSEHFINKN